MRVGRTPTLNHGPRRLTPLMQSAPCATSHQLCPRAGWLLGYSQGGQAVWAANELNSYYGTDLQLQGSVALAPAANVTGAADLAWSGSLTEDQRATFSDAHRRLGSVQPGSGRTLVPARVSRSCTERG